MAPSRLLNAASFDPDRSFFVSSSLLPDAENPSAAYSDRNFLIFRSRPPSIQYREAPSLSSGRAFRLLNQHPRIAPSCYSHRAFLMIQLHLPSLQVLSALGKHLLITLIALSVCVSRAFLISSSFLPRLDCSIDRACSIRWSYLLHILHAPSSLDPTVGYAF